jgi:predicted DNA-binding WGR domain protein
LLKILIKYNLFSLGLIFVLNLRGLLMGDRRTFLFKDATEDNFWTVELFKGSYLETYGKTGSLGKANREEFDTPEETTVAYEKIINEYLAKGYVEKERSRIYKVKTREVNDPGTVLRNSQGGYPILLKGQDIPVCKICNNPQSLFYQLDLKKEQFPFLKEDSHLLVFSCPKDDKDMPNYLFDMDPEFDGTLPDKYWEKYTFFSMILNPLNGEEQNAGLEQNVKYLGLELEPGFENTNSRQGFEKSEEAIFKVGGAPSWAQEQVEFECCCGSKLKYLCQTAEGYEFATNEGAKPQKSWQEKAAGYDLFMACDGYIFACENQCSNYAVFAIAQGG